MVSPVHRLLTGGMSSEESAAIDPTGAAWVAWLALLVAPLLFLALACVRRAGSGRILLVVRRGRVIRSRASGFLARWPIIERFEQESSGARLFPLVIRSRTRDGVDVIVLADLVVEVRSVESGEKFLPVANAVGVAEQHLGVAVAGMGVHSLVEGLEELERQSPAEVSQLLPRGIAATSLTVTQVEAQLTPRVAELLERKQRSGGEG